MNYLKINVERTRNLTLAIAIAVMVLGIGLLTARTAAAQGKIVFTSHTPADGPEIYSANADGTNRTRLTFCACSNKYADISPDGTKVVFMSDRDLIRKYEIYIMNIDGSNQTRLTFSGPSDFNSYPSFAPNGTIVWTREHIFGDGTVGIYVYWTPQNGVGQFEIIRFDLGTYHAEISPDGTKLLFGAWADESHRGADIYVYDMVSHALTNLTTNSNSDNHAKFSPDGTKIIFMSERAAAYDIWIMNVDGSNQVNLTPGSEAEIMPAFSPDGSKIIYVYQNDANQQNDQLYSMNADGTARVNVTNNPNFHEYAPVWGGPLFAPSVTPNAAQFVNAGSSVSFGLGSFSDQDGGSPWTATVNWGDGSADTTLTITSAGTIPPQVHTYARAGIYTMSITVTDSSGLSDMETSTIMALNVLPTISAASGVTVNRAAGPSISEIATVNDPSDPANELFVSVNDGSSATVNGVTVSGITVNAAGQVTASIAAACGATNASFTLRVTDPGSLFATTTLTVTVHRGPWGKHCTG
jgi:Tol biopolymer transport system component